MSTLPGHSEAPRNGSLNQRPIRKRGRTPENFDGNSTLVRNHRHVVLDAVGLITQIRRLLARRQAFIFCAGQEQHIRDQPRVNQFGCEWTIHLGAQPSNGNFDHIGVRIEVDIPCH